MSATPTSRATAAPLLLASGAALLLGVGKVAVGVATGSHALLASGFDSLADALVSATNHGLARFAAQPPDDGHPYGHGKVEGLAAVGQALLLTGAAAWIVRTGVGGLLEPGRPVPLALPAIGALVLSLAGSWAIGRGLAKVGKRTGSLAILSDAAHYQMDAATGIAALVGLGATWMTGWAGADDIASICVAALMLPAVLGLAKGALRELLDQPLPPEEQARVVEVLDGAKGVQGWHALRTRRSGPRRFVDVHIELDGDALLRDAHALADAVEIALLAALPGADVTVHLDVHGDGADLDELGPAGRRSARTVA